MKTLVSLVLTTLLVSLGGLTAVPLAYALAAEARDGVGGVGTDAPRVGGEQRDAAPFVARLVPETGQQGSDLGGKFTFVLDHVDSSVTDIQSLLLVLDDDGEIVRSLPIEPGTEMHVAVREQIDIHLPSRGHRILQVFAPGVLIRVTAVAAYQEHVAYVGPFATIRVDRPLDGVVSASTASPRAPIVMTIAAVNVDPATLKIRFDCVDVLAALGAVLPGGSYSGEIDVRGNAVRVEELRSDFDRGIVHLTLADVPGGTHYVSVEGRPSYENRLPPGHDNWNRPIGQLHHRRAFEIFRTSITAPASNDALGLGPVVVRGLSVHGRMIAAVRVHGAPATLGSATVEPGDECVGPIVHTPFETVLPVSDVRRDIRSGDDILASVDPGVDFLSAIATDGGGHAANDRVRVTLGAIASAAIAASGGGAEGAAAGGECDPASPTQVHHGLTTSTSDYALTQLVRKKVLPLISNNLQSKIMQIQHRRIFTLISCPTQPALTSAGSHGGDGPPKPEKAVAGNEPPIFPPIESVTMHAAKSKVFPLHATDPEGQPIHYRIANGPIENAGIQINPLTQEAAVAFNPDCSQLGVRHFEIEASDGTNSVTQSFDVTVLDADPIEFDPSIDTIEYSASTMDMSVQLRDDQTASIVVDTGPIVLHMSGHECLQDCFFCCCCSLDADFTVHLKNVHIAQTLGVHDFVFGPPEGTVLPVPEVTIGSDDVAVEITDAGTGGCLCWLFKIFNEFGFQEFIVEHFAGGLIADQVFSDNVAAAVRDNIGNLFTHVFPRDQFTGLTSVSIDPNLPESSPVSLCETPSDDPGIEQQSLVLGFESEFRARQPVDPAPPWVPSPSRMPAAKALDADITIGISDDAMNQLMSALSSGTTFRRQIRGVTVGDLTSILPLPVPGIDPATPVVITTDVGQSADGLSIPPLMAFDDIPATSDRVEFALRAQLLVRAVLERGQTLGEDRGLCSCTDPSPACAESPCLLLEVLAKLNFLSSVSLVPGPDGAALQTRVDMIQLLERPRGFDVFESMDLSSTEPQVVATSTDDPLLEALRMRINEHLRLFSVPMQALTMGGWVEPISLRLFSYRGDRAGVGEQDYIGLAANVAIEPSGCGSTCAVAGGSLGAVKPGYIGWAAQESRSQAPLCPGPGSASRARSSQECAGSK